MTFINRRFVGLLGLVTLMVIALVSGPASAGSLLHGSSGPWLPFDGNSPPAPPALSLLRADESTINYEFTVNDPGTYTAEWGGEVPMKALNDLIYEYACAEGNYALENILSGARYQERMEAENQR